MARSRSPTPWLVAALLLALACAGPAQGAPPTRKGAKKVERYPPSFRLAVHEAIKKAVMNLRLEQADTGHWGNPAHDQAMGHTALPLLALLKSGVPRSDAQVEKAFRVLDGMPLRRVYSVGLYMMVIHAAHEPKLDTRDTDVGTKRSKRLRPKQTRKKLSKREVERVKAGLDYLLKAQNASGLWHYDIKASDTATGHDLSNAQYALLGLRAIMDMGFKVDAQVWRSALHGLLALQHVKGPKVDLLDHRVREGYAFQSKTPAEARGFHYSPGKKDGPLGEKTLWTHPETGSMTTAGVACVAICQEGLWRSRRFKGADRKKSRDSIRDGLAWMQEHFSVTGNPGHPRNAHHLYYVYGLERMGMLTGRRWLGEHDWYRKGADMLLERQAPSLGSWGDHVHTSFGILFLKRATRARDRVVTTD
ncbi:MAG: hypothetical protein QNJ90_08440 [Planctomycetota bacterium]|nr:hypothetical protein [Planctomycetota bacterium]